MKGLYLTMRFLWNWKQTLRNLHIFERGMIQCLYLVYYAIPLLLNYRYSHFFLHLHLSVSAIAKKASFKIR